MGKGRALKWLLAMTIMHTTPRLRRPPSLEWVCQAMVANESTNRALVLFIQHE